MYVRKYYFGPYVILIPELRIRVLVKRVKPGRGTLLQLLRALYLPPFSIGPPHVMSQLKTFSIASFLVVPSQHESNREAAILLLKIFLSLM